MTSTTSPTFSSTAPAYWARNIPAIPLLSGQKRPAINSWQIFGDTVPTGEQQELWLQQYADGNIGLPLGPASGLVALDIDTDDPRVLAALDKVTPKSPWTRVGKKGAVFVFRYNGERTFRVKDSAGGTICELLSKGTQIVLPRSIHPDTQLPYSANAPLLDVISMVPAAAARTL